MNGEMRILWVVNIPLPAASEAFALRETPFGGWLTAMTQRLGNTPGVELGVAMRSPVPDLRSAKVDGIQYYALPQSGISGFDVRAEDCEKVLADFRPALVHAEGSEMAYTRRMLQAWDGPRLLSLQGVINGYEPFELGALRPLKVVASLRLRQILALAALILNKRLRFDSRLKGERDAIAMVDHIMGRTPWDQAHAWALNPSATYHHCSRTLRDPFYSRRWAIGACDRHTVFAGNAASPRKGAHFLLDALVLLRREFPKARLVFAGERPGAQGSRVKRVAGYPAFLMDRIEQLGLARHVEFTGVLGAGEMAARMATCHVYAMASVIENSPNTLGEAMMLGMPCVSAYAGGTPGMAQDEIEVLFTRAEDPVTLAYQIKRFFDSDALCCEVGNAARERALRTHDPEANLRDLLSAYRRILGSGEGG